LKLQAFLEQVAEFAESVSTILRSGENPVSPSSKSDGDDKAKSEAEDEMEQLDEEASTEGFSTTEGRTYSSSMSSRSEESQQMLSWTWGEPAYVHLEA